MVIKKKIWPESFEAVQSGKKNFELRLQDFNIQEGDTLILEEWDPQTKQYTGRSLEKKVGYVLKFKPEELPFYSPAEVKEKGLQVIALSD